MIPSKVQEILKKMHYEIVGNHSAVQVCRWTKNSLNGKGVCWKEKFYGIESSRCCQMSPSVMWCENACLHCWRPIEYNLGKNMNKVKIDEPKKILDEIIKARKKLMIGYKGDLKISRKKVKEAFEPILFTLSLSGEATLYPKLPELIQEIRKRKAISFIVTNGQNPEMIKKLEKLKSLPTQLTISMNAPNEKLFQIWHNSKNKDSWKRFNKTLELMKKLKGKTRRAIRLTLVKYLENSKSNKLNSITNMSEKNVKEYSNLIKKANPDFIHVKGFKSLGYSRKRFGYDKQPFHEDVENYAKKIMKELNKNIKSEKDKWKIQGQEKRSCVILISRREKKDLKIKKEEI
ncbi:MAG: radical SAM protein [Candidatus Pacearchaeota archaeon]|jgi:tRNA wybutosine-synthesizing protein 1